MSATGPQQSSPGASRLAEATGHSITARTAAFAYGVTLAVTALTAAPALAALLRIRSRIRAWGGRVPGLAATPCLGVTRRSGEAVRTLRGERLPVVADGGDASGIYLNLNFADGPQGANRSAADLMNNRIDRTFGSNGA